MPPPWVAVYIVNNKALISRITKWKHRGPSITLSPDHDLIQAAMTISLKHRIDLLQVYHVRSHQDEEEEYANLPWEAKLNVDCDTLAALARKCAWCMSRKPKSYQLPPGHRRATLQLGLTWVMTSDLPTAIKEEVYCSEMEGFIMERTAWHSREIFDMVDWKARARAGQQIKGAIRTSIFKLEFNIFATMKKRRQNGHFNDGRCPQCLFCH